MDPFWNLNLKGLWISAKQTFINISKMAILKETSKVIGTNRAFEKQ